MCRPPPSIVSASPVGDVPNCLKDFAPHLHSIADLLLVIFSAHLSSSYLHSVSSFCLWIIILVTFTIPVSLCWDRDRSFHPMRVHPPVFLISQFSRFSVQRVWESVLFPSGSCSHSWCLAVVVSLWSEFSSM